MSDFFHPDVALKKSVDVVQCRVLEKFESRRKISAPQKRQPLHSTNSLFRPKRPPPADGDGVGAVLPATEGDVELGGANGNVRKASRS